MNTFLLTLALLVNTQTHTPTATVSGDVVTVSADFAWVETPEGSQVSIVKPVGIVEGVQLNDDTMLASTDGVKPIAWRLSPGTYKVTAFGYPDNRLFPMRTKIVLDVVIASPTRKQQIAEAVKAYSIASADAAVALNDLKSLKPTKVELAEALSP